MANAIYYPKARRLMNGGRNSDGQGYGPYIPASSGQHHVLVWHSTETWTLPGYARGTTAPHESYDPVLHRWVQHVRHDRAAGTLRGSSSSGVPTNHALAHQLEIIAYSAKHIADASSKRLWIAEMDQQALEDIAEHALWLNAEWGVPMVWREKDKTGPGVTEMSRKEWWWDRASHSWGISDHAQNPDSSKHWDVGAMKVHDVMTIIGGGVIVPPTPGPEEEDNLFCKFGDDSDNVKYWQLRMIRLGADLGSWGADGDYGNATKTAVLSLVPDTDGNDIGPYEAEYLDALMTGTGTPDIPWDQADDRYVRQGEQTITLS